MDIEMEVKMPHPNPTPSKGWRVWDKAVDGLALLFLFIFLPFAALWRAVRRVRQRSRIVKLEHEFEVQHYYLGLGAGYPLSFLTTHLNQLCEMEAQYLATPWINLAEAQVGYKLLEVARAALLAEAQAEIRHRQYDVLSH